MCCLHPSTLEGKMLLVKNYSWRTSAVTSNCITSCHFTSHQLSKSARNIGFQSDQSWLWADEINCKNILGILVPRHNWNSSICSCQQLQLHSKNILLACNSSKFTAPELWSHHSKFMVCKSFLYHQSLGIIHFHGVRSFLFQIFSSNSDEKFFTGPTNLCQIMSKNWPVGFQVFCHLPSTRDVNHFMIEFFYFLFQLLIWQWLNLGYWIQ